MKIRLISSLMSIALIGCAFSASIAQQQTERVIRRMLIEESEPIAITDIKVNDQSVTFNKRFCADDEWLRSLVVSVKNRTDKRILFASIQLQFPRSAGSKERFSVFEMFHGNWSLRMRPPALDETLVGIAAGETVEIRMSIQQLVDLSQFLTATNYPSSIEKVDVRIDAVIFEDDSMWTRGTQLLRDPNNRSRWTIAKGDFKLD